MKVKSQWIRVKLVKLVVLNFIFLNIFIFVLLLLLLLFWSNQLVQAYSVSVDSRRA